MAEKNIQELINYIRTSIGTIYETYEADAIAMQVTEHVLQLTRLQLSLQRQSPVSESSWVNAKQIIQRLQQHEPLQYVLGCAHFYGLELDVNPSVLIPRPETEELVDIIIRENKAKQDLRILDICTGSGCIPIALSVHLKTEKVFGLDISEPALAVARNNALKYKQDITWLQQNILEENINLEPGSLDIIVSNPPYVLNQEKKLMRKNVLDFEPHLALFVPDTNPLLFYRRIAQLSFSLLKPNGALYFEINEGQATNLMPLLKELGYTTTQIIKDLFSKDRFVKAMH
ncbi:peptide chain release factor N(5)-glutamine methyltransferase [Adhaeribacter aquaticus]|uniref:peptide chain release factor N(5)-glutamine methyltransferase n=1 Tax=Adhaeribacter aquaticus TaxID=299567 RepID=UPI0003F8C694|nr:peptide chain release factor N(5)-glutamine methyltransferase [Adhaeribacter aquaticus]